MTFGEFLEYYSYVSACIEDDDYFGYLLSNLWQLGSEKPPEVPSKEEKYEPRGEIPNQKYVPNQEGLPGPIQESEPMPKYVPHQEYVQEPKYAPPQANVPLDVPAQRYEIEQKYSPSVQKYDYTPSVDQRFGKESGQDDKPERGHGKKRVGQKESYNPITGCSQQYEPKGYEHKEYGPKGGVYEPKSSDPKERVYEQKTIEQPKRYYGKGKKDEELKYLHQTPAGGIRGHAANVKGNSSSQDNPLKVQAEPLQGTRASYAKQSVIMENFRKILAVRGPRGIIGLCDKFRIIDSSNTGMIDINDFTQIIKNFQVPINERDIRALFQAYDRTQTGKIDYKLFMAQIKGTMNKFRQNLVEMAFNKIDKKGVGAIDIRELIGSYSGMCHPSVKAGKRSVDQVMTEFVETFEMNQNLHERRTEMIATKEDFIDYYNNVSTTIEDDREFEKLIAGIWQLYGDTPKVPVPYPKKNVSSVNQGAPFGTTEEPTDYPSKPKSVKSIESETPQLMTPAGYKLDDKETPSRRMAPISAGQKQLVNNFRQMLVSRGIKGILNIKKTFRMIDSANTKLISFPEFMKVLKDYRLKYDETNGENLFKVFDRNRSGKINYDEFVYTAVVSSFSI